MLIVISILVLGFLVLFIFTNDFKRKIKVLDCEGVYYAKIIEKREPGYIDFSVSNAKNDVANCLCEKYVKNKDANYKKEILKLYEEVGMKWKKYEVPKIDIDTICKHRNEIFFKMYDM